MATKHNCNKEGEIGMMIQKINDLDKKVDEIKLDLKAFITNYPLQADNKYATKTEVTILRAQVVENKEDQKTTNAWNKDKIFDITWKLALITASGTLVAKQFNVI